MFISQFHTRVQPNYTSSYEDNLPIVLIFSLLCRNTQSTASLSSYLSDVMAETIMEEDVVLQRILVEKVRETVMDLEMEARVMATEDVCLVSSVGQTTARSLASTIMRKMTAVRSLEATILTILVTIQLQINSFQNLLPLQIRNVLADTTMDKTVVL